MKKISLIVILWLIFTKPVLAGPPFRTDDPEPVPYHHGEFYLFSNGARNAEGTSGFGPAIEFNYGILPETQFHLIAPMAYNVPRGEASHFGYGDTEIGIKYRLIQEEGIRPMVGVFPLIELPTGNSGEGLGNGRAQLFLPLWIQKDFGKWTTYGGGGYWINPGPDNKDCWFTGILLQYNFSKTFFLGTELFYQTADTEEGKSSTGFNIGGGLPLADKFQLLFTAGRGLKNTSENLFSYYLALYRAF